MHISRCGWDTQLGPGRHPVSSAYFWYFQNPAGALIEYYADEDQLTPEWQPRDFEPGPTVFAEWAIDGGIDGTAALLQHVQPCSAGQIVDFLVERVWWYQYVRACYSWHPTQSSRLARPVSAVIEKFDARQWIHV